ncbi:response regulator [Cohnella cholangitidis]|uniref:Response regulator n=1 Tax=Cohnella cholangitidis TaxID=2598458 RepID=A0A7G5C678_9BACL|nr:response regulator [Cohnella cholangitidis]QMV44712.1 response regulator [Cohnella cholangitidis]
MNSSQPSESDKIKLLIVDDEPIICEGLRYTIDWERLGVHVVGVAYDGEEALRMIESEEINLLLTDIRMEGMDGLKLTEQLNQRFPDIGVIVISGYESFDYARQALRMNVSDYLLKPVEIDELIAIVSKVVEEIRRDAVNASAGEEELWLANCIHNGPSQQAETPPSYLSGSQFRILTTQLGEFADWRAELTSSQYEAIQQQWLMHVQHSLKTYSIRCISVFDDQNLLYTLAIPNEIFSSEQWVRALEEMLRNWQGDRYLYCGASDVYASPGETGIRCREAAETLGYHALEDVPLLLPEYRALMDNNRTLPTYNDAKNIQSLVSALFK